MTPQFRRIGEHSLAGKNAVTSVRQPRKGPQ
jgi:hypothetical protein